MGKKRGKVACFVENIIGPGRRAKCKRKGLIIQLSFPRILIALKNYYF